MVEPSDPFQCCQFDGFPGFPRRAAMDQLGLVQAIDRLGQGVVVTVATAADRRLDAGFGQAFAIADADVLRSPIGVVGQRTVVARLASV